VAGGDKLKIENGKLKNRTATGRSYFSIFNFQFSICTLALLLSCSQAGKQQTTIEFWALGREGEVVIEFLPQFYKEHPEIRVDVQQIPWTAAHEKLLTAHVGNSFPDMAQIGNTWIPELQTLRAIVPLKARVAASREIIQRDFFPGIWETNEVAGELYGIPWYVDTRVFFYRTDRIPNPPKTWSEWIAIMEALKRDARDPHYYPLLLPTNEWPQPVLLAAQRGAELVTYQGEARFDDPRFIEAFTFYTNIYRRKLAAAESSNRVANLYQQFGANDFSIFISGPWEIGNLRDRLPPELQDKWSTAPLPAPDGTQYPGVSLSGGSSLVIGRRSAKQEACWKLIEFLSRSENQIRFYELSGDLPANRKAWNIPKLTSDPQIAAFRTQLDRTIALPRIPEWENVATKVFEHAQIVALGGDPRDVALQLDREVDAMLEKRRWVLSR
jgi:multiple sugar transport system substrate-binding protein